MSKMPQDVQDLFNDPAAAKMLGTVDKRKNLNVVPLGSIAVIDEETLVFVDSFLGKTKENLEATKRATASVFKPPTLGFQAKGTFMGWQTSGPVFEKYTTMIKEAMDKVGASITPKAVGTIRVDEVYATNPMLGGRKIA